MNGEQIREKLHKGGRIYDTPASEPKTQQTTDVSTCLVSRKPQKRA